MSCQDKNTIQKDQDFMRMALRVARKAQNRGDVPVGAVTVVGGIPYSSGANEREIKKDPFAHAEVISLQYAAQALGDWRLNQATLYVTVEPCLFCSGAIYLSRVGRVVFGCANPKGGALRFVEQHRKILGLNHSVEIVTGICESECAQLLRLFFERLRGD